MEQGQPNVTDRLQVIEKQDDFPVNNRADRFGSDWWMNPRHLAWVSNHRDWEDVFRDLLKPIHKTLNCLKGWIRR